MSNLVGVEEKHKDLTKVLVEEKHKDLEENEFLRRQKLYFDWLKEPEQRKRLIDRLEHQKLTTEEDSSILERTKREYELLRGRSVIYNLCRQDCIFWIENFAWTFDPRSNKKHLPVVLFDYQKDAIKYMIDHINGGQNFLIEKSRDMGVSWLVTYVFLWYWLFGEGISFLMGSYREKEVDDGPNVDALFGKLEYTIRNLPEWMLPPDFNMKKHRTKLKLINPENGNIITGSTMNPNFGRGARKTAIFYDELGFWETARDSWESGADTTACQIANSTPAGKNYYYKLRISGMDVLTLPWTKHPLKDDKWYEYEKARRTPESLAQEIDLSYEKSLEGKVYPEWEPVEGKYPYNPNHPIYIGCDWGNCVSTDTEALTKTGWKYQKDLVIGDEIYTINPETLKGEWNKIEALNVFEYKGFVKEWKGNSMSSVFTGDHKWFTVRRAGRDRSFVPDGKRTVDEMNSEHYIPLAAPLDMPVNKTYTDEFVKGIAWIWTDGWCHKNAYRIAKAKPDKIKILRKVIQDAFPKHSESKPRLRKNTNLPLVTWNLSTEYTEEIQKVLEPHTNKYVSYDFINSLTKEQLEMFIENSLLADGHKNKLGQSEKERMERFAYACVLSGRGISYLEEHEDRIRGDGTIRKWNKHSVWIRKSKYINYRNHTKRSDNVKDIDFKGLVWSPTVKNSSWLARHNGSVYFTGNSDGSALVWVQIINEKLRVIDAFYKTGETIDFFVPFITGMVPSGDDLRRYNDKEIKKIESHRTWRNPVIFGDPAGRFKSAVTQETVFSVLRSFGLHVNWDISWNDFQNRKTAVKTRVRNGVELNLNTDTEFFSLCIDQAAYPKVKQNGEEEVKTAKPLHNYTSHHRSALEYLCLGLEKVIGTARIRIVDKFKKDDKGFSPYRRRQRRR